MGVIFKNGLAYAGSMTIPMAGATSSENGAAGLVPAPLSADRTKYLRGDGSWSAVPAPSTMEGATSQNNGTSGLVPAPTTSDADKFLKGDGTWGTPSDDPGHSIKDNSDNTMARRSALKFTGMNVVDDSTNNQTVISPDLSNYSTVTQADTRYDRKVSWVSMTLSAGSWSGTTYSFESVYPSSRYDILDILPHESTTSEQRSSWIKADCGGYYETNIIVAHGTVPTNDIPVKVCIRDKG